MYPFFVKGQPVWFHDEGYDSGFFHTYDGLVIDPTLDPPRTIHIFLPWDYDSSQGAYPVVYMNDGNTVFWPDGLSNDSWQVPITLQKLYEQSKIVPVIIVAVHALNRSHEYLHVEEFSSLFRKEG